MVTIVTSKQREVQLRPPRWPFRVNWDSPLTDGLVHAITGRAFSMSDEYGYAPGIKDIVTGRGNVEAPFTERHTTHLGAGVRPIITTRGFDFSDDRVGIDTSPLTIALWYQVPVASYFYVRLFSCGPNDACDLAVVDTPDRHAVRSNAIAGTWYAGQAGMIKFAEPTFGAVSIDTNAMRLYSNGKLDVNVAGGTAPITNIKYSSRHGAGGGDGTLCTVLDSFVFRKSKTEDDIQRLYDPATRWSIYEEADAVRHFIAPDVAPPTNPSKVGSQDVVKKYVGGTEVIAEYVGGTKIWPNP